MQKDVLHHFLFEKTPIRGNLVRLNKTYTDVLQHQTLPKVIKEALGELLAASALLATTLKMNGALVLQIQSKGLLKLLVVECSSDLNMRATAKWDGEISNNTTFINLIKDGQCVITLDPKDGGSYQGIVPIEGESISEMLENYMLRSQQIETKLVLNCSEENATGMLLQKLPDLPEQDADAWNRISILADTITNNELRTQAVAQLLTKLFNQEDIRLFDAKPTKFHCRCSRQSVSNMLHMLGHNEIENILQEQTNIEVNCDYCNLQYQFDKVDVAIIFSDETSQKTSKLVH
jgi:molecular chaperone Hsp33